MVLDNVKEFKIVCIPNYTFEYYNEKNQKIVDKTSSMIDLYEKKNYFPSNMISAIENCIFNNARLIYFTLQIKKTSSFFTHANIVIIDTLNKTIERFEPYGQPIFYNNKIVDDIFINYVINYLKLNNYKYIKPESISSKIGIQRKADAYCGMCVTISMMYLLLRILNVNTPQKDIIKYFLKFSSKELRVKILKFAKYVEKTLKKKSNLINYMNYYFFNKINYF